MDEDESSFQFHMSAEHVITLTGPAHGIFLVFPGSDSKYIPESAASIFTDTNCYQKLEGHPDYCPAHSPELVRRHNDYRLGRGS